MLYYHLCCNSKCYFSSSEAYWQKQPPKLFYKKHVLTNFSKLSDKHLCQSLSFKELCIRVSVLETAVLESLKEETLEQVISYEIWEIC